MYYRGSLGALLIFDLTNWATFEHLPGWIEEVRENVKTEIPILLVGNKADLREERKVPSDIISKFAKSSNVVGFIECSAKTGKNVEEVFVKLTVLMIKIKKLGLNMKFENRKAKKKKEDIRKDDGYLMTYTRHMEKRLRNLETEKQLLDAERLRLEQELHSLRNEIDRLREPPLVGAVIIKVLDHENRKALIQASTGPIFIVNLSRKVMKEDIKEGMLVALNQRTFAVMDVLDVTSEEIKESRKKLLGR